MSLRIGQVSTSADFNRERNLRQQAFDFWKQNDEADLECSQPCRDHYFVRVREIATRPDSVWDRLMAQPFFETNFLMWFISEK